jgi:hypothetical protein
MPSCLNVIATVDVELDLSKEKDTGGEIWKLGCYCRYRIRKKKEFGVSPRRRVAKPLGGIAHNTTRAILEPRFTYDEV